MPTHVIRSINVSGPFGDMTWFCVHRTSDGVELCRCSDSATATQICAIFIEKGAP